MSFSIIPLENRTGKRCWFCGEIRSVKYETQNHLPVCNLCAAKYGTKINNSIGNTAALDKIQDRAARMRLIRAFQKASNAFFDSLKEDGYAVTYGLSDEPGYVYDAADHTCKIQRLAKIERQWWKIQKIWRSP